MHSKPQTRFRRFKPAQVTFGDKFPEFNHQIDLMSKALGRNQSDLLNFATRFTTVGEGLGFTEKQAEDAALQLTNLSVALGKAFHTSDADAAHALEMALQGNTKGLKEYNIVLNDNIMQEYLASKGNKQKVADLSEAGRAQATLDFLTDNSTRIQKAAAQSTGDLNDSTKKLASTWDDLKESIGVELLDEATGSTNKLTDAVSGNKDEVQKAAVAIGEGFFGALNEVIDLAPSVIGGAGTGSRAAW